MKLKTVALQVKSAGPDDGLSEGEFLGYASVFGNVDSYGDVVVKGAFLDTLKEWDESAGVIPVLWGHDMVDPFANIGEVLEAKEDDLGLLVKCRLDLENPKAKQVYRLLKGRRVSQMSFAYDVLEGSYVEAVEDGINKSYYELRKLKLYEVSVVPIGANQETEILGVKAAEAAALVKAGRVLSAKNEAALISIQESITNALKSLGEVLAQVAASDDEEKASPGPEVKAEDREPDNAEEPEGEPGSADALEDEVEDLDLLTSLEALELVQHDNNPEGGIS